MIRSRPMTAGLVICGVLGALDIVGLAGFGSDDAPPAAVMVFGAALGVITLVGTWAAWGNKRGGVLAVVVSRVISGLLGVPVFFADDAPDWGPVVVVISIALTIVGLALIYAGQRRQSPFSTSPS